MAQKKKSKGKRNESSIIAEIAKIDNELARLVTQELSTRKEQDNTVVTPAYTPTRVGEQPVPTVPSGKVFN